MEFNANQMREDALIKKGYYKFRVILGREKTASTGNEMLNLKLALNVNNREIIFWTSLYLIPKMFWLIEHFCKATGMPEKIEEGRIMAQDCDNREGYLEIDHRVNKKTGEIEAFVKDFITTENLVPEENNEVPFDDDVPSFN